MIVLLFALVLVVRGEAACAHDWNYLVTLRCWPSWTA